MSEKQVIIRVGAVDTGVARTMASLRQSVETTVTAITKPIYGPPIRPRFELDEQLVRNEQARIIRKMQEDAAKEQLEIHAKVIVDQAKERLFGKEEPKPVIHERAIGEDTGLYYGPAVKERFARDEQLVRSTMANRIREMREATLRLKTETEAQERLFGKPAPPAPRVGPLRPVNRTTEEQAWRDAQADVLRQQRTAKWQERLGVGERPRLSDASRAAGKATGEARAEEEQKSYFEKLKSIAGGRGSVKEVTELFLGAGAIAGLSLAASAVRDLSGGIKDISTGLATGAIKAEELNDRLIAAVPIVGSLYSATKDFALAMTGTAAQLERYATLNDSLTQSISLLKDSGREAEQFDIQLSRAARDFVQNLTPAQAELQRLRDNLEDTFKKYDEEHDKKLDDKGLLKRRAEAQAALDNALTNQRHRREDWLYLGGGNVDAKVAEARKVVDAVNSAIDSADKDLAAKKHRAAEESEAKAEAIRQRGFIDQINDSIAFSNSLRSIEDQAYEQRLQLQGNFLAARMHSIDSAYQQEAAAAKQRREEAQKGLDRKDPRFIEAEDRFERQQHDAAAKRDVNQLQAQQDDERERAEQQRQLRRQLADEQSSLAQSSLRAAGKDADADRIAAKTALEDKLSDMKQFYDEQRRLHAERKSELDDEERQQTALAQKQYDAALRNIRQRIIKANTDAVLKFAPGEEDRFNTGRRDMMRLQLQLQQANKEDPWTPALVQQAVDALQKLAAQTPIVMGAEIT